LDTEFATAAAFISAQDSFEQLGTSMKGQYVGRAMSSVASFRARKAAVLARTAIRARWDPLWRHYGEALGVPEATRGSVESIIARVYRHFVDNTYDIQERNFTWGSPSAGGSNVGNALMRRLYLDADGYEMEVGLAESFVAECVADQGTADLHSERWSVRSADASKDGLEKLGTGLTGSMTAVSANNSLLSNASFTNGTSATSVTNWTFTAGAASDTSKDTTNYYRSAGPRDTATALKLEASVSIQQKIATTGIRLSPNLPYYLQVAWNRQVGSATGTLTIRLGAANTNVVAAAQTGWQILFIPITAANCWWKGFKEDDLDISIEWSETGGTGLLIDDVILTPFTPFRGQWYTIIGGSTPSLLRDQFTWSDSIPSEAKLQYWIQRVYGLYLPAGSTPTWADV
jgi:hypothetical protein